MRIKNLVYRAIPIILLCGSTFIANAAIGPGTGEICPARYSYHCKALSRNSKYVNCTCVTPYGFDKVVCEPEFVKKKKLSPGKHTGVFVFAQYVKMNSINLVQCNYNMTTKGQWTGPVGLDVYATPNPSSKDWVHESRDSEKCYNRNECSFILQ